MSEVFSQPERVVTRVVADPAVPFVSKARVLKVVPDQLVTFKIWFDPWEAMAAEGFPREVVRLEVAPGGAIEAFPLSIQTRTWKHKYAGNFGSGHGPLCLFFPHDPRPITWSPNDNSFEDLLGIISRHLQAEEYFRRQGEWPWEDAPHGDQARQGPRSPLMKALARRRLS